MHLSRSFLGVFLRHYFIIVVFAILVTADFYSSTIKDHVIVKRVYRSVKTNDWMSCNVACQSDVHCSSYNFKLDDKLVGNNCELSECTMDERREKSLIFTPGYVFQQLRPMKDAHFCTEKTPASTREPFGGLESSLILQSRHDIMFVKVLHDFLGNTSRTWRKCYHSVGSHNFSPAAFHLHCDSKGPTVTIVRVDNYVFGGYIDKSWESPPLCESMRSDHAFLFSLFNIYGFTPYKFKTLQGAITVAVNCKDNGPSFGLGYDLAVYGGFQYSYARPHSYESPPKCSVHDNKGCTFYTGKTYFIPNEVEVFYEVLP